MRAKQPGAREAHRPALSSPSEVITMLNRTEKTRDQKARQDNMKRSKVKTIKPHTQKNKNNTRTTALEWSVTLTTWGLKHFYCRQNFTLGPDAILSINIHKKFGSHNGSLTQSMHNSENTKIINHYDETKKSTLG